MNKARGERKKPENPKTSNLIVEETFFNPEMMRCLIF
jgi:hypothetical protein